MKGIKLFTNDGLIKLHVIQILYNALKYRYGMLPDSLPWEIQTSVVSKRKHYNSGKVLHSAWSNLSVKYIFYVCKIISIRAWCQNRLPQVSIRNDITLHAYDRPSVRDCFTAAAVKRVEFFSSVTTSNHTCSYVRFPAFWPLNTQCSNSLRNKHRVQSSVSHDSLVMLCKYPQTLDQDDFTRQTKQCSVRHYGLSLLWHPSQDKAVKRWYYHIINSRGDMIFLTIQKEKN